MPPQAVAAPPPMRLSPARFRAADACRTALLCAAILGASAGGAAAAQPPDTVAQRVLACTGCHGSQGRATSDGYYPRIAGKPADYLYNQLVNFRDGRRTVPSMIWMVEMLPEPYLREIAAHFAAQQIPYPPPLPPAASPATLERGRRLVVEGDPSRSLPSCAACHGESMLGVQPAIPGLLGLPRDYLNAQLGAWRNGTRRAMAPDCMATVARRLAPEDVSAVTAWLAAQPVPGLGSPAPAKAATLPLDCGGG
jgi:cytochrome c553